MLVYIREAHALDGHLPMTYGMVEDPIDDAERRAVATRCVRELELVLPTVVDHVDDKVGSAYAGWPERLFLVDKAGKVAYAGGPGPFGFAPDELEAAICKLLGRPLPGRKIRGRKAKSGDKASSRPAERGPSGAKKR